MRTWRSEIRAEPWDDWVERIVIHVPHYLSYDGEPTSGGRQRTVRDAARLIRDEWHRDVLIAQKGRNNWERIDPWGTPVVGIKARLRATGDPGFGHATARLLGPSDAIVYLGGEDAWPFVVKNGKAVHVGIWWDGPHSSILKRLTAVRTEALFRRCRTIVCVDTNIINWLRARSPRNQVPANQAFYLPNYVDLTKLRLPTVRSEPNRPLRLLFTRRFEMKRGPSLALDAVEILARRSVAVRLIMATAAGQTGTEAIREAAARRDIGDLVETAERDMDGVFDLYESADVAIVPTLWSEGTSYSCIEAIAAGLPVVTTTVGGLPNLVVPGFNGFVVAPRPEPLARAIEALTDPDLWRRQHRHCLSMRPAFSKEDWDKRFLNWLKS